MIPLLIDSGAVSHIVANKLETYGVYDKKHIEASLNYFNERVFLVTPWPVAPVWLMDSKPYWRSRYEPEYKGNRDPNRLDVTPVLDHIRDNFVTLAMDEFEADDLAAGLVREFSGRMDHILLMSCDSDWAGLVSEGVTLLRMVWEPRVFVPMTLWDYMGRKIDKSPKRMQALYRLPDWGKFIPRNVWDWKAATGDVSDNLAEGTPLGLISLANPIEKVWEQPDWSDLVKGLHLNPVGFNDGIVQKYLLAMPDLPMSPIRDLNHINFEVRYGD